MYFKQLTLLAVSLLLPAGTACAGTLPQDSSAGVVYSYAAIADDDDDDALSLESFRNQMDLLSGDDYHVTPLPDLIKAHTLPRRSVGLSFDEIDSAFLRDVAPLLADRKLPYTIFISPGQIDAGGSVTWDDLRKLSASSRVTVGLTAYNYAHTADWTKDKLAADLNHARDRVREELKLEPSLFAYPFGEYSPVYKELIAQQGFTAAFGQQSGVIASGVDMFTLPRFTMTEDVSDPDRLRMTSDALPFPVTDLEPASSLLTANPPFPGFTVSPAITAEDIAHMTCFASGIGQLDIQKLGHNRVEIRFPRGFDDTRGRVNCTMPVPGADDPRDVRWRWLGLLYTVPDNLIDVTEEDSKRDEITP